MSVLGRINMIVISVQKPVHKIQLIDPNSFQQNGNDRNERPSLSFGCIYPACVTKALKLIIRMCLPFMVLRHPILPFAAAFNRVDY